MSDFENGRGGTCFVFLMTNHQRSTKMRLSSYLHLTLPIINTSPLMFPVWSSHSDAMLVSGQNMSRLRVCVATKGTARFLSSVRSFSACLIFVVLFAVKRSSHVAGCCFNENLPQTQQTTVLFIDESSDGVMNGWICGTASPVMSDTKWWR